MARRERLAQMGEMGAMLAHEIRNPLAGIKGYAQVIEKKPEENRNAGFAQRIVAEVLRLEDLVNDLLAYAGSGSYSKAPVDLCGLMVFATSHVRHEADQQHVTIVSECREGLAVLGNRDKLGQVLLNLATNALQAMPEGGTLEHNGTRIRQKCYMHRERFRTGYQPRAYETDYSSHFIRRKHEAPVWD